MQEIGKFSVSLHNFLRANTKQKNELLMKINIHFILLASFLVLFSTTSCSDDNDHGFTPTLPANGGEDVKEITHSSNMQETYNWKFNYQSGRLVYVSSQLISSISPINFTASLSYKSNQVKVVRSDGNNIDITLNPNSLLISTLRMSSFVYNYNYDDNRRLIRWNCAYIDPILGVSIKRSYGNINYDENNDIRQIQYVEDENNADNVVTLNFTPSAKINLNGLLPEGVSEELGMKGLEYLYYGGLLGKSTYHLVESIDYQYAKTPDNNHTVTYQYGDNGSNGNIVSCTFGNACSVQYAY